MDKASQEMFDLLIAKGPEFLGEDEKAFLRARQDYMTKEQKETFADALKQPKPAKAEKEA